MCQASNSTAKPEINLTGGSMVILTQKYELDVKEREKCFCLIKVCIPFK